jgi:hypothetical protein
MLGWTHVPICEGHLEMAYKDLNMFKIEIYLYVCNHNTSSPPHHFALLGRIIMKG